MSEGFSRRRPLSLCAIGIAAAAMMLSGCNLIFGIEDRAERRPDAGIGGNGGYGEIAGGGGRGGIGGTGGGTTTSTTCAPQLDFGDPTCNDCFWQACCSEAVACDTDPDCANVLSCRDSCSDQGCVDQCDANHSNGAAVLQALDNCELAKCSGPCP